jgi:hypothetical protein
MTFKTELLEPVEADELLDADELDDVDDASGRWW